MQIDSNVQLHSIGKMKAHGHVGINHVTFAMMHIKETEHLTGQIQANLMGVGIAQEQCTLVARMGKAW